MTAKQWKNRIKKACVEIGTYKEAFDTSIDVLADIMERRDAALASYNGIPIVEHTNSHGETNSAKHPALMLANDCEKLILSYMRDLGLTAKGLKSIDEKAGTEKPNNLAEMLAKLET